MAFVNTTNEWICATNRKFDSQHFKHNDSGIHSPASASTDPVADWCVVEKPDSVDATEIGAVGGSKSKSLISRFKSAIGVSTSSTRSQHCDPDWSPTQDTRKWGPKKSLKNKRSQEPHDTYELLCDRMSDEWEANERIDPKHIPTRVAMYREETMITRSREEYRAEQRRRSTLMRRSDIPTSPSDPLWQNAPSNLLQLDLQSLTDTTSLPLITRQPLRCKSCVRVHQDKVSLKQQDGCPGVYTWKCVGCNTGNESEITLEDIEKISEDMLYEIAQAPSRIQEPKPSVPAVFYVMDISASMSINVSTREFSGTRLEALCHAVQQDIEELSEHHPDTLIGVVTFHDVIESFPPHVTRELDGWCSWDEALFFAKHAPNPQRVKEHRVEICQHITHLQPNSGTALGPGLVVAVGWAAEIPGAEVIVCTDGEANVGLGTQKRGVRLFYGEVGKLARDKEVKVSIYNIGMSDVCLSELGIVCRLSGGEVKVERSIANGFQQDRATLQATQTEVALLLDPAFNFEQGEDSGSQRNLIIGRVSTDTAPITFPIIGTDELCQMLEQAAAKKENGDVDKDCYMQVQTKFEDVAGNKYLRISNLKRKATMDREKAESDMTPAGVGIYRKYLSSSIGSDILMGKTLIAKGKITSHAGIVNKGKMESSNPAMEQGFQTVEKILTELSQQMTDSEVSATPTMSGLSDEQAAYYYDFLKDSRDLSDFKSATISLKSKMNLNPQPVASEPQYSDSGSDISDISDSDSDSDECLPLVLMGNSQLDVSNAAASEASTMEVDVAVTAEGATSLIECVTNASEGTAETPMLPGAAQVPPQSTAKDESQTQK